MHQNRELFCRAECSHRGASSAVAEEDICVFRHKSKVPVMRPWENHHWVLSRCGDSEIALLPKKIALSLSVSNHPPFLNVLIYDIESLPAEEVLFWKWQWSLTSMWMRQRKQEAIKYHNITWRRWVQVKQWPQYKCNGGLHKSTSLCWVWITSLIKYFITNLKSHTDYSKHLFPGWHA